jgi:DNA-binding winged helix-turn-helix (wHTH) protein
MGNSAQTEPLLRFQDLQVNLETGEVWKAGVRLKVQDQPFKVLTALLQRPGQIVTREELRQLIWPNESFGDFDHAVNLAIAKLRASLGDSADVPHLIETLPRRGYRFIAPVHKPNTHAPIALSVSRNRLHLWVWVLLIPFSALIGSVVWFRSHPSRHESGAPTTVPLTSYPGEQCCASFSPDASQVAFVWRKPGRNDSDIYVKVIGAEAALRITNYSAWNISPAWSPDGRLLSFLRLLPEGKEGVFLVSPLGGPERKIAEISRGRGDFMGRPAWFPDSRWLAIAEQRGISVLSVETGERHLVTDSPPWPGLDHYDDEPQHGYDCQSSLVNSFELEFFQRPLT